MVGADAEGDPVTRETKQRKLIEEWRAEADGLGYTKYEVIANKLNRCADALEATLAEPEAGRRVIEIPVGWDVGLHTSVCVRPEWTQEGTELVCAGCRTRARIEVADATAAVGIERQGVTTDGRQPVTIREVRFFPQAAPAPAEEAPCPHCKDGWRARPWVNGPDVKCGCCNGTGRISKRNAGGSK